MKKEIVKQENCDVPCFAQDDIKSNFLPTDLSIPKLWLLQAMSDVVVEGKAKIGDFWLTSHSEPIKNPIFTPILYKKVCFVSSKTTGSKDRFKLESIFQVKTVEDEKLPWNETVNGKDIKREYAFVFFGMLEGHDTLPVSFTLKSTSYKSGQKMATQMYVVNKMSCKNAVYYPSAVKFKLLSKTEKGDDGSYAVVDVKVESTTTNEEQTTCFNWYNVLSSTAFDDLISEDSPPPIPTK
ncbi:MAG: hypothetical protein N2558_04700 [Patescibacteria group bacterium]|nr:hypothetical protein [Patescibacteria group bacterium]